MKYFEKIIYCPRCKGSFDKSSSEYFQCVECGFKFFLNAIAANGAVLKNSAGEILLVERKFDPHKGLLDVPGGFLEVDESAEESIVREIKEELQLVMNTKDFMYISGQPSIYEYQNELIPTIDLIFEASLPENQTPVASDDAGKIHFFLPKDIPMERIAFDGVRKALELYQKSH